MALLGAVLAGGQGRRMGKDKAEVEVSGVSFLDRVATSLGVVADHVVVLGAGRAGYETWPDQVSGSGPLAGVATALGRMEEDRVLVVAVDNVFVRPETLTHLTTIVSDLPVVPVDRAGVRQVTCAVYPRQVAGVAREEAESGGSIQTMLDRVSFLPVTPDEWEEWGEDGRSWFSADTSQALDEGLRRFG
ncbi:MAG TPA: molybdenum cofactor guanylyltransferase [Acidimicrobiia bacterium]|nr:molybdenum cofactor guanylyltransferase [Acidimicrobiia bacterium]